MNGYGAGLDGKSYRYLIRQKSGDDSALLFIQEDVKEPGNLIEIDGDTIYPTSGNGFGIGPADVKEVIRQSIMAGWEPSKKGPPVRRLVKSYDIPQKTKPTMLPLLLGKEDPKQLSYKEAWNTRKDYLVWYRYTIQNHPREEWHS